ncbi:MAG: hypothetical protein ACXWUG_25925 [Polyangiales bacterium]
MLLERGSESVDRCGCCGKRSHTIRGFLSEDGPVGVYFAGYTEGHEERIGTLIVSLGDWSEEATPASRVAFVTKVRVLDGQPQVMLVDPEDSPWDDIEILGRLLTREEALAHPMKATCFHAIDHILAEDDRFTRYFEGKPKNPGQRRR